MEYRSKEELEGNVLEISDIVVFNLKGVTYKYTVRGCFLANTIGRHDAIFSNLDLKKYAFASTAYGYSAHLGIWPEYKDRDYEAATRLVLALYEEIENPEAKPTKMTKTQRIEALEAQVAELTKLITPTELAPECGIAAPKFDPENLTVEDMPIPWLCVCKDDYGFGITFVNHKDADETMKTTFGRWYNFEAITPIPFSQWPKLLVDHYNEHREELGLPELPTF